MDERDYQFMNNELNHINMDNFKLDITQLTPVEEKDRVKGNWYVAVEDLKTSTPWISQWHSIDRCMNALQEPSVRFKHWFLIPPNLPGFPVAELPDEINLKGDEWEFEYPNGNFAKIRSGVKARRITPTLPQLTIPSGTRAEQIEAVKKLLNELQTNPNE